MAIRCLAKRHGQAPPPQTPHPYNADMSFPDWGLPLPLSQALRRLALTEPTPVQAEAYPAAMARRDVLAQAQTGSGKTLAYLIPLLSQWLASRTEGPRWRGALVLVPTRELALQVGATLADLTEDWRDRPLATVAYGGVSINPQLMRLRGGADILVATPGRLLDLVRHNAVHLERLGLLVLDEADRLLDEGFADEVQQVLDLLPGQRQTLLFSATYPQALAEFAQHVLIEPVLVDVPSLPDTAPDIRHRVLRVAEEREAMLLRGLIESEGWTQALVFVSSQYRSEHLARKLQGWGLKADALHGQLSQGARARVLGAFRERELQVMLATDLAARGIDIPGLPVVVNLDLPRSPMDFRHRVGRTGRAGASGEAWTFVTPEGEAHWRVIAKRMDLSIATEDWPGFEVAAAPMAPADAPADRPYNPLDPDGVGGVKGRRKSKKDKLREAAAQAQQAAMRSQRAGTWAQDKPRPAQADAGRRGPSTAGRDSARPARGSQAGGPSGAKPRKPRLFD